MVNLYRNERRVEQRSPYERQPGIGYIRQRHELMTRMSPKACTYILNRPPSQQMHHLGAFLCLLHKSPLIQVLRFIPEMGQCVGETAICTRR